MIKSAIISIYCHHKFKKCIVGSRKLCFSLHFISDISTRPLNSHFLLFMGDNGKLISALKVYRYVSMVLPSGAMCSKCIPFYYTLLYTLYIRRFRWNIFAKIKCVSCWLVVLGFAVNTNWVVALKTYFKTQLLMWKLYGVGSIYLRFLLSTPHTMFLLPSRIPKQCAIYTIH